MAHKVKRKPIMVKFTEEEHKLIDEHALKMLNEKFEKGEPVRKITLSDAARDLCNKGIKGIKKE